MMTTADEPIFVRCDRCGATVQARLCGQVAVDGQGEEDDYGRRHILLQCCCCEGAILASQERLSFPEVEDIWDEAEVIFPDDRRAELPHGAPYIVSRCYREAVVCFRAHAYHATVLMCRRTIEAICRDRNCGAENLKTAIRALRDASNIDETTNKWAEQLRVAGNQAAHTFEEKFSHQDADDLLDLTVAIAAQVYVYRVRFEAYKNRHPDRSSGQPSE